MGHDVVVVDIVGQDCDFYEMFRKHVSQIYASFRQLMEVKDWIEKAYSLGGGISNKVKNKKQR